MQGVYHITILASFDPGSSTLSTRPSLNIFPSMLLSARRTDRVRVLVSQIGAWAEMYSAMLGNWVSLLLSSRTAGAQAVKVNEQIDRTATRVLMDV